LALFIAGILPAQQPPAAPPEPPEEDTSLAPKEYSLNPVQAAKEIVAGNFYFKKSNYHAAMRRYTEATRWDPGSSEAFLKLGESSEKAHDYASARDAYTKYVELAKDAKDADSIRKRIEKLPKNSGPAKDRPEAAPTQPLDKVPDPDRIAPGVRTTPTRRR
jgi:tetratricopeptide (TPR) repeat protein